MFTNAIVYKNYEAGINIPMYEPLEKLKCEKCGIVIAEPKKLIRN